jgi:hypothetical protein
MLPKSQDQTCSADYTSIFTEDPPTHHYTVPMDVFSAYQPPAPMRLTQTMACHIAPAMVYGTMPAPWAFKRFLPLRHSDHSITQAGSRAIKVLEMQPSSFVDLI